MYTWINEQGETIRTKTIREFADRYHFRYSNASSLACGHSLSLRGWTSTHPKAKKRRKRITMELINTVTGERKTLGRSVTSFARSHGLSIGRLYRLINRRRIKYKDWMLAGTYDLARSVVPDGKV